MQCYVCGKVFFTKEELREHIKTVHPEKAQYILSNLRPSRIKNLKNPENWAAGVFIAYTQKEKSNKL